MVVGGWAYLPVFRWVGIMSMPMPSGDHDPRCADVSNLKVVWHRLGRIERGTADAVRHAKGFSMSHLRRRLAH